MLPCQVENYVEAKFMLVSTAWICKTAYISVSLIIRNEGKRRGASCILSIFHYYMAGRDVRSTATETLF